jgi:hypothetical protein
MKYLFFVTAILVANFALGQTICVGPDGGILINQQELNDRTTIVDLAEWLDDTYAVVEQSEQCKDGATITNLCDQYYRFEDTGLTVSTAGVGDEIVEIIIQLLDPVWESKNSTVNNYQGNLYLDAGWYDQTELIIEGKILQPIHVDNLFAGRTDIHPLIINGNIHSLAIQPKLGLPGNNGWRNRDIALLKFRFINDENIKSISDQKNIDFINFVLCIVERVAVSYHIDYYNKLTDQEAKETLNTCISDMKN